jgi:hypothetical protein
LERIRKMAVMISFLNLFLVPFISVSIYSRRHGETVTLSGTWLVRYAVFAVCNVPITYAGIYAVRFFLHREVFQESARYTVVAMCVAFVLPYVCDLFNKVFSRVGFHVEKREDA